MGDALMKKHEMTEEDIKLQFITPAIELWIFLILIFN